jgi:glycosyltransferase involved in cell wall biosynthesis
VLPSVRPVIEDGALKIVHAVGWYFPESTGGTEIYVAALCQRLKAAHHRVLVAAPLAGLPAPRSYDHEGVTVFRYPVPARPTRDECQHRVPARGTEHFHDWLRRQRPDVVHVHTLGVGLSLPEVEAARETGARVVATNHLGSLGFVCQRGTLMQWGRRPCDAVSRPLTCAACALHDRGLPRAAAWAVAAAGWPLRGAGRQAPGRVGSALGMPQLIRHNQTLQRRLLDAVDCFVLLNRRALEAVLANGAPREKLALNHLGVSHTGPISKPGPAEQPTRAPVQVGYFGRLVAIKGVLDLARAFASLPSSAPVRLEFRGPVVDSESQAVRRRLERLLAHDPRVRFAPAVPPAAAPRVLAGYDVLVVPSVWFENGPTVVSEAHAVGTPVVGTRIGAIPEAITDGLNGRLVEPGDWRGLADVLREIAGDPRGQIDRWRAALPRPRTMDAVAADYLTLYGRIAARPARGG